MFERLRKIEPDGLRSWLKKKWSAFRESPLFLFFLIPLFLIAFVPLLLLVILAVTIQVLGVARVPGRGRVVFEVVKRNQKWIEKNHNDLARYCEEGYAEGEDSYPPVSHLLSNSEANRTTIKAEFEPELTTIDDIKEAIKRDGLETNILESKITPAHRRFLFWTFDQCS